MAELWINGNSHTVPLEEVVPWMCGAQNSLDTIDVGRITLDVNPVEGTRSKVVYLVELDDRTYELGEEWVLPWMRGLSACHGLGPVSDPGLSARAQCVQALMVGHRNGLFRYTGFINTDQEGSS